MTDMMEHDMTTTNESAPAGEAAPAVVALKPKNTHRLNRIFRKPKTTVVARKWRNEDDEHEKARAPLGVPLARLQNLIAGLTEAEKARAAAGQEPLSATQEALAKRAERFGLPMDSPAAPKLPPHDTAFASSPAAVTVDEETLRRREARFKTAEQAELEAAMQRRLERFGQPTTTTSAATKAPVELQLSEADRAAMEARARRFAA